MSLPALLRSRAASTPDAVAVRDGYGVLSYADLVAAADRLAHYLPTLGVHPGTRVASVLPRGLPAVVAQVAVFTFGAVHVPVNPSLPQPLLTPLLADIEAFGVLALREQELPAGPVRIDLDDPCVLAKIALQPARPFGPGPDLDAPAYVIHTSGSSGRPKAVAVSHRAISHTMQAYRHRYPDPITEFALASPMWVDASLPGIWWTLLSGGCVRLLPHDADRAMDELVSSLSGGPVSHVILTPSVYRAVLGDLTATSPALRQVMVAGEVCPKELVADHHRLMPGVELVNGYGPTEAAVWCTSATLRPDDDVLVGLPIAGTEVWVLDPGARPVPIGQLGEVCLAGPHLAQCYLGDPELTRARFVAHPNDPARRVYRTGDLGRLRADGQLELRGRLDRQVKLSGFRVELDGVAAALRAYPGVRDAVVVAGDGLVAYVVPEWDGRSAVDALRSSWNAVTDDLDHHDVRIGWDSSYSGERLSEQDIDEWVDETARIAREGDPRSLLDLGCGTGMVLTQLAHMCDRVVGIDISQPSLDALARRLDAMGLRQVELRHGDARDVGMLTDFDLVLCNSVTLYFPDSGHLADVLAGALGAVSPRGRVVFGDVKDLSLEDARHAAVVLARAADGTPVSTLRERWRRRVDLDPHLQVDPRWFARAVGDRTVEVRPQRGSARTEMSDFRFNVIIHSAIAEHIEVTGWKEWPGRLDVVRGWLAGDGPVGVLRVPNKRTAGACAVRRELKGDAAEHTADSLRVLAAEAECAAVHPDQLAVLAAECGWTVRLSRASAWADGELDAVFLPPGQGNDLVVRWPARAATGELANLPVHRQVIASAAESLLPDLREYAATHLPVHERPAAYIVMTELPITESGKVDLAALLARSAAVDAAGTPFVEPALPAERQVARIFAELLGVDRVGLYDDFVSLGGDSLLAVRVAARLNSTFGTDLRALAVFGAPTVAQLTVLLATASASAAPPRPGVQADRSSDCSQLPLAIAQQALRASDLQTGRDLVRDPDFALESRYRIRGPLDVGALATAVAEIVARHEVLSARMVFADDPQDDYQVFDGPGSTSLRTTHAGEGDLDAALAELQAAHPLAPQHGRILGAELVSDAGKDHLLALRLHHLACDGHTVGLLERQISQVYQAVRTGSDAGLPASPSYREVLVRQSPAPDPDDVRYWTRTLGGCRPVELVPPAYLKR